MEKLHAIIFLFFVVFALITFQCVESETFFIMAISEKPCFEFGVNSSNLGSGHPRNINKFDEEPPCLTLQQFVTRLKNGSYQNLTNTTLELDWGEHSLNSTLSIFNIPFFMMSSGKSARIICSQPGVRLQVHYIEDVVISGISFIGCEEIEVSFVDRFRFENSSFQSSPNGSLTLNHTMNATITGSSFLEMTQGHCDKAAMTINNSSVLVQYCTFLHSEACIYSTLSDIAIDGCTFMNNSLMGCGQEFYSTPMITALNGPRTSRSVTVTNSNFIDNRKLSDSVYKYTAAFMFIDGSILAQNNNFVNNAEFEELLCINTNYNQIIMDHNNISKNEIYPAIVYIDGSNISITISHNNFRDNTGPAVMIHARDGTVTINDTNFSGNRDAYNYGNGAVSIGPTMSGSAHCSLNVSVTIAGCTFIHNYPPRFELEREHFQGAVRLCLDTGPVSIVHSTFIDNLAFYHGGAAVKIATNSSVLIDSCSFIENKSPGSGAVYIEHASSILINHTNFINNEGSEDYGGALSMFVGNALIIINESYFYGNLNTRLNRTDDGFYASAGTVYLSGKRSTLVIDKTSFVNNAVNAYDSGTIYVHGSQMAVDSVIILRSNFTNNTIRSFYGGLFMSTNTIIIDDSTFYNNSGENCGALSIQAQNVHLTNSHFVHNGAVKNSGGAICTFEGLRRMVIVNSTFSHNYAKKNGGVLMMLYYDDRTLSIDIYGSTFDNNRAGLQGGVFWINSLKTFYISNSLFIKNQAGSDGGVTAMNIKGYYYNETSLQLLIISGSIFNQNKAIARGGAIAGFTPWAYLIDNSSFTGNQAGTDGGVMYVGSNNSLVRISEGSAFGFNNATSRGGVISINGSRLKVSNTILFNNNFAGIGDDIIACNCDISIAFRMLQSYTDPNFPNCTLYGHYVLTTAPPKPAESVVTMAISIPLAFIMLLLLFTATLLGAYLCFRRRCCLVNQYRVRSSDHPDFQVSSKFMNNSYSQENLKNST